MNLGENIYRLRTERNMSQGDLADALDVSRQSVSKWENNNAVPELDKLMKLSELFGVTLDELVGSQTNSSGEAPEPQHQSVRTQTLIGIALLCCSILSAVTFLITGPLLWILLISLPLGIGSVYCLVTNERIRRRIIVAIVAVCLAVGLCFFGILLINLANFAIDSTGVSTPVTQETAYMD